MGMLGADISAADMGMLGVSRCVFPISKPTYSFLTQAFSSVIVIADKKSITSLAFLGHNSFVAET